LVTLKDENDMTKTHGPLPVLEIEGRALICLLPGEITGPIPASAAVSREVGNLHLATPGFTLVVPDTAERALRMAKVVTLIEGEGGSARILGDIVLVWDS
jgi:hypothetical protein